MHPWRLIEEQQQGAAWNMAADEAMLSCYPRLQRPTLRLYAWQRPTLSLGYFQPLTDVDLDACARHGIDVVRRPTGGRAVLHHHEVTYSVVAGLDLFPPGVAASYRKISRTLTEALEGLGIRATLQRHHTHSRSSACFDTPAFAELTVAGKKVSGSAQTRTKHALLQHGSLPLRFPWEKLAAALGQSSAQLRLLKRQAAGLCDTKLVSAAQLKMALIGAFEKQFGPLTQGALTAQERSLAEQLEMRKYNHLDWTHFKETPHAVGR